MRIIKKAVGTTFTEMIFGVSMVAILVSLAVPSYSEFIAKRKVSGAANLISTFIENTKMLSIKRHEYATISYMQSENSDSWCLGAVIGKDQSCDCMAEVSSCVIDSVPSVLASNSYVAFKNINANFTDGMASFDPVRGILTDPTDAVSMDVKHESKNYAVSITVNATGRVRKCSSNSNRLVGYAVCI